MQRVNNDSRSRLRFGRWGLALVAALTVGTTGCDSLLDVENPNNVVQSDLEDASSVNALVNGALAIAAEAVGDVALSTADLSDEFKHTGSQNWAAELDVGSITNPEGRSDELFNDLSEARWMSEEAIATAEEFAGELTVPTDLARANLISGIVYLTIGDNFEDFTFSNRTEVGPPIGEANMSTVYDIALERLTAAESEAAATGAGDMVTAARALQARAHWAKALWGKLNPPGSAPADPLINSAQANALAAQVVGEVGATSPWEWAFLYSPSTQSNPLGSWTNSRQEFAVNERYAQLDAAGRTVEQVTFPDPVDGTVDVILDKTITDFVDDFLYPRLPVINAQELHLILAEAALASGDDAGAVTHINHVRAIKAAITGMDVTPYDPATHAPSILDMIIHERNVNLFMMAARRIHDQYRFDIPAEAWAPGSDATRNGQVFVIGQDERVSNCFLLGTCS